MTFYAPGEFPKVCKCGRSLLQPGWQGLRLVGTQEDEVETLELRDCPCGSTLAVLVATSSWTCSRCKFTFRRSDGTVLVSPGAGAAACQGHLL